MTAELRLRLEKRELIFPDGVAFCLVCGEPPAGKRRVWFENLAAGAGALAWWLASESWPAALVTVWCVIMALGLALVPLVASAFRNFDPSLDTPD